MRLVCAVLRGAGLAPASAPGTIGGSRPLPLVPLAVGLILLALALFAPGSLAYKFDVLGFGVCHQLLSRSFLFGGQPLPVCARCTGIYLGAGVSWFLLMVLRPRAVGLPAPIILPVLGLMFLTMVADGLNSTLQSVPGGQGLWETTNLVRIITGALAGMAVAFLLYPLFNDTFWQPARQRPEPVIERPYELFGYGLAVAVPVALTVSAAGDPTVAWIYWPMAVLSQAGLLLLLTLANTMLVTLVTRRSGRTLSTAAALTPLAVALALAVAELLALAAVRGALAPLLIGQVPPDLPLIPGIR